RQRARSGEDIPAAMVEQQLAKDALIRRHLDKIAKQEQDIAELSGRLNPSGAETYLPPMQAALKSAQVALEERRKELLPQVRKELQEKALSALDAGIAEIRHQTLLDQEEEKMLSKIILDLEGETHEVGKNT